MKKSLWGILLLVLSLNSFAQSKFTISDSTHILWQPDLKITFKDYNGCSTKQTESDYIKYGCTASSSVGIWSILDIPEKKRDRNRKFEIIYFAPAFERTTSYAKTNDSLQIQKQNLYFDICEVCARWARKELKSLKDSTNSIGIMATYYMTIKEEMNKMKMQMFSDYYKEVIIDKTNGAYEKWRLDIDNTLNNTKEYATTPQECYRLLTRKPIEKNYIQAPMVVGPMTKNIK